MVDRTNTRRRGQSLLEVIAASTILALTLAPALAFIRDGLDQSNTIQTRELATTLCVSKLEEGLALASATWSSSTTSGDFSALGYSQIRFRVVSSDLSASGGIPDRLMAVTATVWEDRDGDLVVDAGEPQAVLASKAAKLASYPG